MNLNPKQDSLNFKARSPKAGRLSPRARVHVSYSLNSFKRGYTGDYMGDTRVCGSKVSGFFHDSVV